MELKEFISNTLTQIADGVSSAIDASEGRGYFHAAKVTDRHKRKTITCES